MPDDEFAPSEIEKAYERVDGRCECCGKHLSWSNSRGKPGRGAWEAHHGGRSSPVILCVACHLNYGHKGNFQNRGITPKRKY